MSVTNQGLYNQLVVGYYTGTGAALTETIGFKPNAIVAFNETDGDLLWFHIQGMTDATAATVVLATAQVASQGCTLTSTGFTLGTDATINETGKVYKYIAF